MKRTNLCLCYKRSLGVPVVARNIVGNQSLVRHEETGLMFDTPQQFINQLERLLELDNSQANSLCETIVDNARRLMQESQQREQNSYLMLFEEISSSNT
jgi:glycosyltransferase involved in cell wall biosynthesis